MRNLKDRIFSLYEELAKIDRESEYETFCAQWGDAGCCPGYCSFL